MREESIKRYVALSQQDIADQLRALLLRSTPEAGHRQEPFTPIETLLCYGLFSQLNPRRYGGRNIETVPPVVKTLSAFFHRTPGSITNKMLNLDGSRTHSALHEPLLFATLASEPLLYPALYTHILITARQIGIDDTMLPDFLGYLSAEVGGDELFGQDDLPENPEVLLKEAEDEIPQLERAFNLEKRLTEKLVERKTRLAQHWFAQEVLHNCGMRCVFCGFEPRSLPHPASFLRASHIKPWARSTPQERVDIRNGLTACPMHDVAFDRGYLTVNGGYRIHVASSLHRSIDNDPGMARYFGETLYEALLLPQRAKQPATRYLSYHQKYIFKG